MNEFEGKKITIAGLARSGAHSVKILAGRGALVTASDIKPAKDDREVAIHCRVQTHAKTGVEMEALTGATVAALTLYDMAKAVSHGIVIKEVRLLAKTGGKQNYRGAP